MNCRFLCSLGSFCLTLLAVVAGCVQRPPQVAPAEPPVVPVSHPISRKVIDYVYYTGRTDAVEAVPVPVAELADDRQPQHGTPPAPDTRIRPEQEEKR